MQEINKTFLNAQIDRLSDTIEKLNYAKWPDAVSRLEIAKAILINTAARFDMSDRSDGRLDRMVAIFGQLAGQLYRDINPGADPLAFPGDPEPKPGP